MKKGPLLLAGAVAAISLLLVALAYARAGGMIVRRFQVVDEVEEQESAYERAIESSLYAALNEMRASRGLPRLRRSEALEERARDWAEYLRSIGSVEHSKPPYAWLPPGSAWGEVIFQICGRRLPAGELAREAVEAWLESPEHRDVICYRDFEYAGAGAECSGDCCTVVVQFSTYEP